MPDTGGRPLRADAQRNRDRLLEVAVRAFSRDGPDVTLDAIAKDAGVGIEDFADRPARLQRRLGGVERVDRRLVHLAHARVDQHHRAR